MKMKKLFTFTIVTAIFCFNVQAITLTSLTTKGTFENAGIRVTYTDDDNKNATIAVEYRKKGDADWKKGHPLIRIVGDRFVTSLFNLREGITHEVRLIPNDPEGVTINFNQPFEITTRSSDFPAGGKELYVDVATQVTGDGSQSSPFKTITEAADIAQAGDIVHIMPGTYTEQITPANSGNDNAYIHYIGEGNGAILDGAENVNTAGWIDEGESVYSTAFSETPNYATLDTIRLYKHSSLANLKSNGDGITGGFFIDSGKMYVKSPDGKTLTDKILKVSIYDYGFLINEKSHIVVSNIEIRYFNSYNVRIRNSQNIVIRSCLIHHSRQMIRVDGITSTDNLIEKCIIYGTGVTGWPWQICHHGHDCSSNAISISNAGEGNVIRGNYCKRIFNGIYLGQWTENYPDENALENDVYDNVLEEIADDGLEPECKAINLRMYRNRFKNVYSPISLAPIETGPTWIMYNVVDDTWPGSPGIIEWGGFPGWVKIATTPSGERPVGAVRIYHNTAYIHSDESNGWGSVGSGNTHFKNNIVHATRYVFENTKSDPYPVGNDWDYNNFYTTDTDQYIKFENIRYDIAGFQAATGFQKNGIAAPPLFMDVAKGDFKLKSGDPGIDKGVVLPGVNDAYNGSAPDMGAFEYSVVATINPVINSDFKQLNTSGSALKIYDLTGRLIWKGENLSMARELTLSQGIYIFVWGGYRIKKLVTGDVGNLNLWINTK